LETVTVLQGLPCSPWWWNTVGQYKMGSILV